LVSIICTVESVVGCRTDGDVRGCGAIATAREARKATASSTARFYNDSMLVYTSIVSAVTVLLTP
jgi:hypothetical protein